MIVSAKLFLFLMLILGIAVQIAAFNINSNISKCKSQLAQTCLRVLFILGSTLVAIPLTSFIVCPNIDNIGSELTGKLLVLFMFLVGGGITALGSIINAECKEEKNNTMFPIILGVIITAICLLYFYSSFFSQEHTQGQQAINPFMQSRDNQKGVNNPFMKSRDNQKGVNIPMKSNPQHEQNKAGLKPLGKRYRCWLKPDGKTECFEHEKGEYSEKAKCEKNCHPDVAYTDKLAPITYL